MPKTRLQRLVDRAADFDRAEEAKAKQTGPMSPEVASLVGEARKALKRFGAEKDVELEAFRSELDKLSTGEGKLSDVVEAARALMEKNKKPEKPEAPAAAPAEKGRLMGAAKRLVEASDQAEKAAPKAVSGKMQEMMEAARQAVGRIKNQNLADELAEFREALNSNDPARAAAAANRLLESEAKATAVGQPKPPVEHDTVMAAARRVADAAAGEKLVKGKPTLPPDIAEILAEAKKAVGELTKAQEIGLSKLVDQAEKQAANMTKQKIVKNPVEALPPELQALVDKSERIVDRFGGVAKGERAALLLARTGRTVAEQEQLARSVTGLTPNQVASVLEKLRTSKDANKPGWFFWLWQQGLISGLVTHTGYAMVNTATVLAERVISPFVANLLARARGQEASLTAPLYANVAMIHSLPDAFSVAGQAFKTGLRIPLESEMRLFARGEESPQAKGAAFAYGTPGPDWGIWKRVFNEDQLDTAARVLGIPGRSANMLHTFYKVLSENAAGSTIAYEAAAREGAKGDAFWRRYQYHLDNPSDDALRQAVNEAYSGAFMAKLGPMTTAFAHTVSKNPILKWFFPFQHIPWNVERMSIEYSPFKILGPEMRASLLGQKGEPAQNLAIAKMVVGSSVLGYFMHKALVGEATSDYPTDPKERARWETMRIHPNSIQVGGNWVSVERLGPAGNVAHMGAAIGSIIKNYDGQDDDAFTKAIWAGAVAAANQVGNEVGFQSLKNLFEVMNSEKKGERVAAQQLSSFIYPSSFLRQTAAAIDPYEREVHNITAGMKYTFPSLRETLLPKLDALYGEPSPNPAYHAIKRTSPVNVDPVRTELDRLKIYPAHPEDQIRGVKLPENLYHEYQQIAGGMTKVALQRIVGAPGWPDIRPFMQENILRETIKEMRERAAATMQFRHKEIFQQAMQNQRDKINGVKPTKLQDVPEAVQ